MLKIQYQLFIMDGNFIQLESSNHIYVIVMLLYSKISTIEHIII